MKQLLVFLFCIMLISCPIPKNNKNPQNKSGKTITEEVIKQQKTIVIYEGEVPDKLQTIDLSQYITEDQKITLIVYNVKSLLLCCPEKFVFNFQVDDFDKESFIIKDKQQFIREVTTGSIIKWSAFGQRIKIELNYE